MLITDSAFTAVIILMLTRCNITDNGRLCCVSAMGFFFEYVKALLQFDCATQRLFNQHQYIAQC